MTRQIPLTPAVLLVATVLVSSALWSAPAWANGFGGGGEGMSWRYEVYLEKEAEAERKTRESGAASAKGAKQKAGLGTSEAGEAGATGNRLDLDNPDTLVDPHTRGR